MDIKYYKILQGYEHERDVTIREDELERAYGLFMLGGRSIFSGGPVDGKNIQTIVEDYHTTMGWNKEYKLIPDDFEELTRKGIDRHMRTALSLVKEKVQHLIDSKQSDLIGKNVEVMLPEKPKEISEGSAKLAEKFSIKFNEIKQLQ